MHSIEKLSFDISYNNEKNSISFQNELGTFIQEQVTTEIEKTLDAIDSKNEFLFIEQVNIELDRIAYRDYQEEVLKKINRELRIALQDLIRLNRYKTSPFAEQEGGKSYSKVSSLEFYLRNGRLPWWVQSGEKFANSFDLEKELDTKELKQIFRRNSHNINFLKRFIYQFSIDFIFKVLQQLFEQKNYNEIILFYEKIDLLEEARKIAESGRFGANNIGVQTKSKEILSKEISKKEISSLEKEFLIKPGEKLLAEEVLFQQFLKKQRSFFLNARINIKKLKEEFLQFVLKKADQANAKNLIANFIESIRLHSAFEAYLLDELSKVNKTASKGIVDSLINPKKEKPITHSFFKNTEQTEFILQFKYFIQYLLDGQKHKIVTKINYYHLFTMINQSGQLLMLRQVLAQVEESNKKLVEEVPMKEIAFMVECVFGIERSKFETYVNKVAAVIHLVAAKDKTTLEKEVVMLFLGDFLKNKSKDEFERSIFQTFFGDTTNIEKEKLVKFQLSLAEIQTTIFGNTYKKKKSTKTFSTNELYKNGIPIKLLQRSIISDDNLVIDNEISTDQKTSDKISIQKENVKFLLTDNISERKRFSNLITEEELSYLTRQFIDEDKRFLKCIDDLSVPIFKALSLSYKSSEAQQIKAYIVLTYLNKYPDRVMSIKDVFVVVRELIKHEFKNAYPQFLEEVVNSGLFVKYNLAKNNIFSNEEIKTVEEQKRIEISIEESYKNLISDIYIKNAGLVLLAPYFTQFFKILGLVDGRSFINSDLQERAVFVLQYLATKNTDCAESELVLNKLLCGMDIKIPIRADIELTKEEKAESEKLLSAVISHWAALKTMSPDSLRVMFLQREGKLEQQTKDWKLSVARNQFDLLIEKIPWTFNIVKAPWMDYLIFTEW